jgi:hypothetical protein
MAGLHQLAVIGVAVSMAAKVAKTAIKPIDLAQ